MENKKIKAVIDTSENIEIEVREGYKNGRCHSCPLYVVRPDDFSMECVIKREGNCPVNLKERTWKGYSADVEMSRVDVINTLTAYNNLIKLSDSDSNIRKYINKAVKYLEDYEKMMSEISAMCMNPDEYLQDLKHESVRVETILKCEDIVNKYIK